MHKTFSFELSEPSTLSQEGLGLQLMPYYLNSHICVANSRSVQGKGDKSSFWTLYV